MNRLEALLLKWQDSSVTEAEVRELNALLPTPEARARLVQTFQFDALTRLALQQLKAESDTRAVVGKFETLELRETVRTAAPFSERLGGWLRGHWWRVALPVGAAAAFALLAVAVRPDDSRVISMRTENGGTVLRSGRTLTASTRPFALRAGDEIRLPDGATADVSDKADTLHLRLTGSARMQMTATDRQPSFALLQGAVNVIAQGPAALRIRAAQTDISGANFEISIQSDAERVRLDVESGIVAWRRLDDGRVLNVAAGQFAVVAPEQPFFAQSHLPDPWQKQDVGEVAAPASVHADGATITLAASGRGRPGLGFRLRHGGAGRGKGRGNGEGFHFVYRMLEGDGEIRARVATPPGAADVEAGVLIRRDLRENAPTVFVGDSTAEPSAFRRGPRGRHGRGPARPDGDDRGGRSYWLRLVRAGNTVTAYRSTDGEQWSETRSEKVELGQAAFVGLAASSHAGDVAAPVIFDHVAVIASR